MLLKRILRNLNLINIVLVVIIAAFVQYKLMPRLNAPTVFSPTVSAVKNVAVDGERPAENNPELAPQEFEIISELNLFHPDRQIVKYTPPPPPQAKLPPPDFVLYGTLVSDSLALAFIDDRKAPFSSPGRGPRHKTLKKGDTISGFTVKDIDREKVLLARNGEEIVLKKSGSHDDNKTGRQQPAPRLARSTRSTYPARTQPGRAIAPAAAAALTPPTIITVPAVYAAQAQATSPPPAKPPIAVAPKSPLPRPALKPAVSNILQGRR